ncbi:MAG TPA: hypothetical protein VG986_18535 [Pseudolabrys sp.]|nr:hypothetical protein [Pseudolabrys sp.]
MTDHPCRSPKPELKPRDSGAAGDGAAGAARAVGTTGAGATGGGVTRTSMLPMRTERSEFSPARVRGGVTTRGGRAAGNGS